jgi:hypothetical protein
MVDVFAATKDGIDPLGVLDVIPLPCSSWLINFLYSYHYQEVTSHAMVIYWSKYMPAIVFDVSTIAELFCAFASHAIAKKLVLILERPGVCSIVVACKN